MTRYRRHVFFQALILIVLAGALGCDSGVDTVLLEPPAILSPANGAAGQPNALMLTWHPSAGAETYHAQVSDSPDFSHIVVETEGIATPALAVKGLQLGVAYHWRVRAVHAAGVSAWSAAWRFTPAFVAQPPTIPALVFPAAGAVGQPTTILFEWGDAVGAYSYDLQISQEPSFLRKDVEVQAVSRTLKNISGLVHGYTYYWRVRAVNAAGVGPWSPAWQFVVVNNG